MVEKDTDLAVQETEKRFVDGTEEAIEGNSSDEAEFTIEDGVLKSYNYGGMVKGQLLFRMMSPRSVCQLLSMPT